MDKRVVVSEFFLANVNWRVTYTVSIECSICDTRRKSRLYYKNFILYVEVRTHPSEKWTSLGPICIDCRGRVYRTMIEWLDSMYKPGKVPVERW